MHQGVVGEVFKAARNTALRQIRGTGAIDDAHRPQCSRHQRTVLWMAATQHAVEALAHYIDQAVSGAELDFQLRMRREERRQLRQHERARHATAHVHPQAAAQLPPFGLEHRLQFFHVRQHIAAALVEGAAIGGGLHAAGSAMQELGAQARFQLLDRDRHAGLGQAEGFGGAGKAAQLHHPLERSQRLRQIHDCFQLLNS